ncbi:hypothetical protein ABKN59_010814 [Abortiporus biennis]
MVYQSCMMGVFDSDLRIEDHSRKVKEDLVTSQASNFDTAIYNTEDHWDIDSILNTLAIRTRYSYTHCVFEASVIRSTTRMLISVFQTLL